MNRTWRSGTYVALGLALVGVSVVASFVAAPFLVPYLQLVLCFASLPGSGCGVIAGFWGSRRGALLVMTALTVVYVVINLDGTRGILAAIQMHLLGLPPPGVMYFDTWTHLFHALVIPLNFGVALLTYELVARRRFAEAATAPPTCNGCGYNLTGNTSGRCPECGSNCPTHPL